MSEEHWGEDAPNVYVYKGPEVDAVDVPVTPPLPTKKPKPPAEPPKARTRKPKIRPRPVRMAKRASISVVMMTHNRNGERLSNTLDSLLVRQYLPPKEVIVVDTSSNGNIAASIAQVVNGYSGAKLIRKKCRVFSKPLGLNIGIRASSQSNYLACMDADVMLSDNFIQVAVNLLGVSKAFVLTDTLLIPEHVDNGTFESWAKLRQVSPMAKPRGPGSFQAASRNWWLNVHGYDERFAGGLGGMDDDMWIRAKKGGLEIVWITPDQAQALHQWHPRSTLKGKTSHLFVHNPKAVANDKGWGR